MSDPHLDDLPAGVQDWPATGWPLIAAASDTHPVPEMVGTVWVPRTFHSVIGPGPDNPHDPDWIVTLMYGVVEGDAGKRIDLVAAMAGGDELPEALERLKSLRPLRWWQRRALRAVVVDEAARALEAMDEAEWQEENAPQPLNPMSSVSSSRDWLGGYFASHAGRRAWAADQLAASEKVPLGKRRGRITRDHLEQVARVYREAWDVGDNPTAAVAAHFGRPHSTAADWVLRARRAGVLGPAQGKRGGER